MRSRYKSLGVLLSGIDLQHATRRKRYRRFEKPFKPHLWTGSVQRILSNAFRSLRVYLSFRSPEHIGYNALRYHSRTVTPVIPWAADASVQASNRRGPDGRFTSYASLSNSVRYLGASALAFSMNAISSFSSSLGGGVVRVATGTPTSTKNLSCPAGQQIQSMRTGPVEVL